MSYATHAEKIRLRDSKKKVHRRPAILWDAAQEAIKRLLIELRTKPRPGDVALPCEEFAKSVLRAMEREGA